MNIEDRADLGMLRGWRARIGYVYAAPGIVSLDEARRLVPDGCLLVGSSTLITAVSPEGFRGMADQADRVAHELAKARVDIVVQDGTAAALVPDLDVNALFVERFRKILDVPVILMMDAVLEALRFFSVERLVVASVWTEGDVSRLNQYLTAKGYHVLGAETLGGISPYGLHNLAPGVAYQLARRALSQHRSAEGIFICGGAVSSLEIVEKLEFDTGLPVVTSATAAFWAALRTLGIRDHFAGLGRLMGSLAPARS